MFDDGELCRGGSDTALVPVLQMRWAETPAWSCCCCASLLWWSVWVGLRSTAPCWTLTPTSAPISLTMSTFMSWTCGGSLKGSGAGCPFGLNTLNLRHPSSRQELPTMSGCSAELTRRRRDEMFWFLRPWLKRRVNKDLWTVINNYTGACSNTVRQRAPNLTSESKRGDVCM